MATAATPCVTRAGCSSGSRGFTPNAKLRTCRYETTAPAMRPLRTLVVVHASLVPPESLEGHSDKEIEEWRTEYDVTATPRELGHDARCVGVLDSLTELRGAIADWQPDIGMNMREEWYVIVTSDQYVVARVAI